MLKAYTFKAEIGIIGINPFVSVPPKVLKAIFKDAGKEKGAIPICGDIDGHAYKQTLLKYKGEWRLYINTTMLKDSPKKVGTTLEISVAFDPADRSIQPHPKLIRALNANKSAKQRFEELPPSRKKEIIRYIALLKTDRSVDKNIGRAIAFLNGKGTFVGRDKP